jgi:hypothetical protein
MLEKKKLGRPEIYTKDNKPVVLSVRMPIKLKDGIYAGAKKEGMGLKDFMAKHLGHLIID